MWWVGTDEGEVHIGRSRCLFLPQHESQPQPFDVGALGDQLEAIAVQAKSLGRRARLRVWLSAALCRPFLIPTVNGTRLDAQERERMASALAVERTGLAGPCKTWVDPAPGSRLAVATEQHVLDLLRDRLHTRGVRAASIRPWWSAALQHAVRSRPSVAALAVLERDAMTVLLADGGQFASARSFDGIADEARQLAEFRRLFVGSLGGTGEACVVQLHDGGSTSEDGVQVSAVQGSGSRLPTRAWWLEEAT